MIRPYQAGEVVISKAGHEAGQLFIVMQSEENDFVTLCDGRLRTLEKPKRKRVKHIARMAKAPLFVQNEAYPELLDAHLRKHLDMCAALCYNKEVKLV
ncbi:MAG: KOW domain-containing RNA-binding protein [Clostridiales bacterium]|nr:KOW domain-containing RNA-binding protein [Clostridiales bacterium]